MLAESLEAADEDAQTGRVEEAHLAHVGDDVHHAVGREVQHALAQARRGVRVDLPGDLEDGAVAGRPDDLRVEFLHAGAPSICHR